MTGSSTDGYTFTVRTSKYTVKVKAKDPFAAAVAAVKTGKFKTMGQLLQIDRQGAESHYCSSERVCKAAGMWSDE